MRSFGQKGQSPPGKRELPETGETGGGVGGIYGMVNGDKNRGEEDKEKHFHPA